MPVDSMDPFADINLEKLSQNLLMYIRKELNQESADYLEPPVRLTGGLRIPTLPFLLPVPEWRNR